MAKIVKFTLTGKRKGKTCVINDRYQFVDGEYMVPMAIARKQRAILVEFYACSMEVIDDSEPTQVDSTVSADPLALGEEELDPTIPSDAIEAN